MISFNISFDGGTTSTSNLSVAPLANDPFYSETSNWFLPLVLGSFLALLVSVVPLVTHAKTRNWSAISMVVCIMLSEIFNIINPFIWPYDDVDFWWSGEGYCDIETNFDIYCAMSIAGSLACIMRQLAQALDTDNTRLILSRAQRWRSHILVFLYCVGFPLLLCIMHWLVQPFRFYVFATAGCVPAYSSSWLNLMLVVIWPAVVSLISVYYAILLMVRIVRYHRDFAIVLSSSSSGMSKSRFVRLFASATIMLVIVVLVQGYSLYRNTAYPITTWDWASTHDPNQFQTIVFVPAYGTVFSDRWIRVGQAIPVFLCFGWGKEATTIYRRILLKCKLDKFWPSLRSDSNTAPSGTSSTTSSITAKVFDFFTRRSTSQNSRASVTSSTANLTPDDLEAAFTPDNIELQDLTTSSNTAANTGSIQLEDKTAEDDKHCKAFSIASTMTVVSNGTYEPHSESNVPPKAFGKKSDYNPNNPFTGESSASTSQDSAEKTWEMEVKEMKEDLDMTAYMHKLYKDMA